MMEFVKDTSRNIEYVGSYVCLIDFRKCVCVCVCVCVYLYISSVQSLICVQLFATPWAAVYQAPPSMGFSRQECQSGLSLPSPIRGITEFLKKLVLKRLT